MTFPKNEVYPVSLPELIAHKIKKAETLEEISAALFEYLLAGNGVFLRAKRQEFSVSLNLSETSVKNLPDEQSGVFWHKPQVSKNLWTEILLHARRQTTRGVFKEDVYVIFWSDEKSGWSWRRVSRERTACSTIADDSLDEYKRACIELHTHPAGAIHFSPMDDRDESGKFRIFGILIDAEGSEPRMRFRCGVYEHFIEIPFDFLGEMPDGVTDLTRADLVISKILKR